MKKSSALARRNGVFPARYELRLSGGSDDVHRLRGLEVGGRRCGVGAVCMCCGIGVCNRRCGVGAVCMCCGIGVCSRIGAFGRRQPIEHANVDVSPCQRSVLNLGAG